jgi:DNA repair exonuclease SbcCD ATPase subunit
MSARPRAPFAVLAFVAALGAPLVLGACQQAYFATMEQFGVHKREILVDRVGEARTAQDEAKKSFVDALEAFRAIQTFDGGSLEKLHKDLAARYATCKSRADEVTERIGAIEDVSEALFEEWQGEIDSMSDASLRSSSAQQLSATKERYGALIDAMRKAESRMEPVLVAFNDRVLFLKHNLNAQAIASLEGSLALVQSDVSALIAEMEASIAEADAFVAGMQPAE